MRTYTVRPLRTKDFLLLYERAALTLQKKYLGHLIGFFVSEIGALNQVVHLWGFESLAERERRRQLMEQDPGWNLYRNALLGRRRITRSIQRGFVGNKLGIFVLELQHGIILKHLLQFLIKLKGRKLQ